MLEAALEEVLGKVPCMAQRLWTSDQRHGGEGVPAAHRREFCSLLNAALRGDDPALLAAAMPLIRAINSLCVVRGARPEARLRFPPAACCLRGGGLPDAHLAFFEPELKFRVPGYLATSFDREAPFSPPTPTPRAARASGRVSESARARRGGGGERRVCSQAPRQGPARPES